MRFSKIAVNLISVAVVTTILGGCSTIGSAYEKTKETVSGWFK